MQPSKLQRTSKTTLRGASVPAATARRVSFIGSLFMLFLAFPAHAVLERQGPVSNDPQIGGFPTWYQDTTGLALEFCDPLNQSELDGGWCVLLNTDTVVPESFPTVFF